MFAFALVLRVLGLFLFLAGFTTHPRGTGRHRASGCELDLADASIDVNALPHERRIYLTIQGDYGDAIAGLRPGQARQLAAALLRQASLAVA
jgi:hypothetical protein